MPQHVTIAGEAIGEPLTDKDLAKLTESWITPEVANLACIRRVGDREGRELRLGHRL